MQAGAFDMNRVGDAFGPSSDSTDASGVLTTSSATRRPHGLRKVAEGAKLEVLLEFSPGMTVAADFIGMRSSYWRTEDLLKLSDTHPMNVFLLARKPLMPHQRRTWARHNQTEGT
mmetsp:Transcript_39945/g.81802  ORF Transcript_39945/g.81802 Transcript_39945/m.81802 type:complete len:115 (+) Transcript_39945:48-392(+)